LISCKVFENTSTESDSTSMAWVVSTFAGSTEGFANGAGSTAQFDSPSGVAVDSRGNVYVADADNHRIR
ncbi:SBBP repeat-containing protein, partial [Olavius algarvensis spirochete endosymbiont]|uniref:SBBP repeat-containing protein n=1 Tax=Olavius algarvensis spirochete endosymbiont TaxID=260710 RepID=UPI0018A85E94